MVVTQYLGNKEVPRRIQHCVGCVSLSLAQGTRRTCRLRALFWVSRIFFGLPFICTKLSMDLGVVSSEDVIVRGLLLAQGRSEGGHLQLGSRVVEAEGFGMRLLKIHE